METKETLQIHHIAKRLPYGLKVQFINEKGNEVIDEITGMISERGETWVSTIENGMELQELKPILFPSSHLLKTITMNGKSFIPINFIYKKYESIQEWNSLQIKYCYNKIPSEVLQQIIEWHFDTDNLIEQGLAISVFELKENPYA